MLRKYALCLVALLLCTLFAGCESGDLSTLEEKVSVVNYADLKTSSGYKLQTKNLTCIIDVDLSYAFGGPDVIFKGKASGIGGHVLVVDNISLNGKEVIDYGDIVLTDGGFEADFLCVTDILVEDLNEISISYRVKSLKDGSRLYETQTIVVVM
jgi:hypothetical protein